MDLTDGLCLRPEPPLLLALLLIILRGEGEWAVGVGLDYHSTGSPTHTNETTCDESPLLMPLVV